jgi:hypothetical protein
MMQFVIVLNNFEFHEILYLGLLHVTLQFSHFKSFSLGFFEKGTVTCNHRPSVSGVAWRRKQTHKEDMITEGERERVNSHAECHQQHDLTQARGTGWQQLQLDTGVHRQ